MTLIGSINKKYVYVSNRVTKAYRKKMGLFCDIYYPKNESGPNVYGTYEDVDIFAPRQSGKYNEEPYADVKQVKFYIPHLVKRESINSTETDFDSFYGDDDPRPFIECSKADELPVMTKVVVYLENSVYRFYVDKQTVVNGADGHMLLRQYLVPLSDDGQID